MRSLKVYFLVLIGLSCVCGMCSKNEDDSSSIDDGSTDGYVEPAMDPNGSWITMTSGTLPSFYGPTNVRPVLRKWIATKTVSVFSGLNTTGPNTDKNYLSFSFENADKFTRFCTEAVNPGGKEAVSISLKKFNRTAGPASYTMDVDFKEGACWYYVYKKDGTLLDSTRTQAINSSTLNVTKMTLVSTSTDGKYSVYKISGDALLKVMYWKNGTSSTTDIHTLDMKFNNQTMTLTNF